MKIYLDFLYLSSDDSEDTFDQYLTQLLHSTSSKSHLPPIQRGQHHVFSAEHTTRDILSLMAQVQGLNLPSELFSEIKQGSMAQYHHTLQSVTKIRYVKKSLYRNKMMNMIKYNFLTCLICPTSTSCVRSRVVHVSACDSGHE